MNVADDTGNDMKTVVVTSPSNVIFIGTGSARVKLLLSNSPRVKRVYVMSTPWRRNDNNFINLENRRKINYKL